MAELRLKKLFEERESLRDQVMFPSGFIAQTIMSFINRVDVKVRQLKSQLDRRQKNGTDEVQNPEGDHLEDSHLLDLQSECPSCLSSA